MAGETYVIKTGELNYFWPHCHKGSFVALMFDKPYFEAWASGDKDVYFDVVRQLAKKNTPEPIIRREATIWFNNGMKLRDSVGDVFINRVDNNLYWATTKDEPSFTIEHEYQGVSVVALCKPVDNWSRFNAKGTPLQWQTTHNRAKDFLSPYPALFRIDHSEMQDYLDALLHGDDLSPWHQQPSWKIKQGEDKGKSLGKSVPVIDYVVTDLWHSMVQTTSQANGQLVISVKHMKNKTIVGTEAEMRKHLAELWEKQEGRCALSGIPMHAPGQDNIEPDLRVSPDRIDSNGHYEIGNIQLVCRFINYWKCAAENGKFLDLLDLVIEARKVKGQ